MLSFLLDLVASMRFRLPTSLRSTLTTLSECSLIIVVTGVTLLQGDSGGRVPWVDFDLGNSPGWVTAIVATYCQGRVVEHSKSKSTQPRYSATRVTL